MGGIVEFGTGNDGHKKPIVPQEERAKAFEDADEWGVGYLYDERRLDPSKIEMVFPPDAPVSMTHALNEYFERNANEQA